MTTLPTIGLLGADKQAAVSAALAWPERQFLFVSDQRVVDGWDLPNVDFHCAGPAQLPMLLSNPGAPKPLRFRHPASHVDWIPLCARWLSPRLSVPCNALRDCSLAAVLPFLANHFGDIVLPVSLKRPEQGECIVKGDRWHRPDAPLSGSVSSIAEISDPYGCGIVYQPLWAGGRQMLASGRRFRTGAVEMAVIAIHGESCARDDVLSSGETIRDERISEQTLAMLESLDHRGFFTMNWLKRGTEVRLSSFRPVPRALFRTLRRAGCNLFDEPRGICIASPGLKFTVDIHYSSYEPLVA